MVKIEEAETTPAVLSASAHPTYEDSDVDLKFDVIFNNMTRAEIKTDFNVNDKAAIDSCSDSDIDETINNFMKREPSESSSPDTLPAFLPVEDEPQTPEPPPSLWKSDMKLARFRKQSVPAADDFLAWHNIPLRKGKKEKSILATWSLTARAERTVKTSTFGRRSCVTSYCERLICLRMWKLPGKAPAELILTYSQN